MVQRMRRRVGKARARCGQWWTGAIHIRRSRVGRETQGSSEQEGRWEVSDTPLHLVIDGLDSYITDEDGVTLSGEWYDAIISFGKWGLACRERENARLRRISCNRHADCEAVNRAADAAGKRRPDHCHDDCCEECFGS